MSDLKKLGHPCPYPYPYPKLSKVKSPSLMHGYIKIAKMTNLSCRIESDTSLFVYKIRIHAVFIACSCLIHAASGHHRWYLQFPYQFQYPYSYLGIIACKHHKSQEIY